MHLANFPKLNPIVLLERSAPAEPFWGWQIELFRGGKPRFRAHFLLKYTLFKNFRPVKAVFFCCKNLMSEA